ncbi:MAG TPA: glycoside hydrolase family 3 C-terminal domain-containing protein [Gemmatimonadales bacterium]|jgi:beta-glucosidase
MVASHRGIDTTYIRLMGRSSRAVRHPRVRDGIAFAASYAKRNRSIVAIQTGSIRHMTRRHPDYHFATALSAITLCVIVAPRARPQAAGPAVNRPAFGERARDLVSRMTLEEKVSQMMDVAPAIERLGIPAYNWWNEALHGVARSGLATVFPQAIGLAATWNDSLVHQMASVVSDEARAKYNEALRGGSRQRYQGLTFWSPNINIFRDPRWGRGQETYGEDPFLSGRVAVQFIRGMQGDDPEYLKTVSTVKHFAVHSGPEPARHTFDAEISERDLRESYLPQFRAGIETGGAWSLMCAYNRLDGLPACGSDLLLKTILRGDWNFQGYVVSDCGAIDDIYQRHKVAPNAAAASAAAVRAGTDLECGDSYTQLVDAVHAGLIAESIIDTAVSRLFTARMKLGMFDPPDSVPWSKIPYSDVDSPGHKALAREVARQSIVLLKNQDHLLPLRKTLRAIAVIGPDADDPTVQMGNYNGSSSDTITPLQGIRAAVSRHTAVRHARGADLADGLPAFDIIPAAVLTTPRGRRGLAAEFFASRTMQGRALFTRTDTTVNANWRDGAPRNDMNPDDFGVRWSGTIRPPVTGTYRLALSGTVRYELRLDDSVIVRSGFGQRNIESAMPRLAASSAIELIAGRNYRISIDAAESYGVADLQLLWQPPADYLEGEAVAAARDADAVVIVLGLSNALEGEEMRVQVDGFTGGDRTRLDLPDAQQRLLQRVMALGKPTVLVLLNGSALAVNWASTHVPAIVEAWYPGEAGGAALADVLFGDYNPAGRLPVTFYRSVADLPPFDNYNMAGRTYRFFDGPPLYPFGYGLSYTTFAYDSLRVSNDVLSADATDTVRVNVTNTGTRAGDEVVQLYVQHLASSVPRPREDLRGYQRVTLRPGETKTVSMLLPASTLAYWNTTAHGWMVENEPVRLEVGASSADIRLDQIIRVGAATK